MTKTNLEYALEYIDRGWSVIPIRPDSKRPAIKWQEYQDRIPTEEEVTEWWSRWPNHWLAIVTGALSGVVVVDCDNPEALHAAFDAGMRSPSRVSTKRGTHLYFIHPRDGIRRGPRAGVNSRGADWPRIDGLDFRGDGSYALLPPSPHYKWSALEGHDWDEMPVWQDWRPRLSSSPSRDVFDFATLDLSDIKAFEDYISEWDRTAKYVRDRFPSSLKIPTGGGNGRNERVMRHASECILAGHWGDELRLRCRAFMSEFFADPLPDSEFEATCSSMEQAERRNHPERFSPTGEYLVRATPDGPSVPTSSYVPPRRLITMPDAEELLSRSEGTEYLIEPWLRRGTIVQVYGYSGHGKSLFVQHALAALCSGRKYFGPFEITKPARVLYLDFEMGQATIARRLIDMRMMHGDTADRLQIWAPFLEDQMFDLNSPQSLEALQKLIELVTPDVVVIDTIRSAWPGLEENKAENWGPISKLALALRNSGLGVILVHHSNKPTDMGEGREAGSTAQLTVLETQIRVMQVYADKATAHRNAALFDGDYETPVWEQLQAKLPADSRLFMVMEVSYGKVREWTDAHDRTQWIGFGQSDTGDERYVVSSRSTKQRAKDLALDGLEAPEIASTLQRPVRTIRKWLEI